MSIAASFTATDQIESRRHDARHKLSLLSRLTSSVGANQEVTIMDISSTGLLLQTRTELAIGETIRVELEVAGARNATIIWSSGIFYGCRFDSPLTKASLSAAQLRGSISAPSSDDLATSAHVSATADKHSVVPAITRARKSKGFTQSELAKMVGVSKTTVWNWENGSAKPRRASASRLAALLDYSLKEDDDRGTVPHLTLDAGEHSISPDTLANVVRWSKERIAFAAGTTSDRVTVSIEI